MNEPRELGKIESVELKIDGDHGVLLLNICFDFGGSGQCFQRVLDQWSEKDKRRVGHAAGLDLILQMLQLFNVHSLDEIVGRHAYALRGNGGFIDGIETTKPEGEKTFHSDDWAKRWDLEK